MLENRSFDQMLGFLYTDAQNISPAGDKYDGLTGKEFNLDSSGNRVTVFRIDQSRPRPYLMPGCDPREGFEPTNLQVFGVDPVPPGATPTMGRGARHLGAAATNRFEVYHRLTSVPHASELNT